MCLHFVMITTEKWTNVHHQSYVPLVISICFCFVTKVCSHCPRPPHFLLPLVPDNHHSTLLVWVRLFLDSTYNEDCTVYVFCAWLFTLSIMSSTFTHIVTNVRILFFLWANNIQFYTHIHTHTPQNFFILHTSTET